MYVLVRACKCVTRLGGDITGHVQRDLEGGGKALMALLPSLTHTINPHSLQVFVLVNAHVSPP